MKKKTSLLVLKMEVRARRMGAAADGWRRMRKSARTAMGVEAFIRKALLLET